MQPKSHIHLVECPRDAMQGWKPVIPTHKKVEYINALLQVGFDTIDFGSFVSARAIPQMADTKEVIEKLNVENTSSKLLAIIANVRGAEEAAGYDAISYLGFPFSISETFQQRNTNSSINESLARVEEIRNICSRTSKQLVIYISMGFGNPYGDEYNEDIIFYWVEKITALDIHIVSMADTIGIAAPEQIGRIVSSLIPAFPGTEIGVHLHSTAQNQQKKIDAALNAGCRRFDGALKGIGGCPMADDVLVGNMKTEWMISYFNNLQLLQPLNLDALQRCTLLADEIFETNNVNY